MDRLSRNSGADDHNEELDTRHKSFALLKCKGKLKEAVRKLEHATGGPLAPVLERRQSSRLKNRATAAPYPPVQGSSSSTPRGDASTGLTPLMSGGMDLGGGFEAEAHELAEQMMEDLTNMRKTMLKRASTLRGQAIDEEGEDAPGSRVAGSEEVDRRSQSMPVKASDGAVHVNAAQWREHKAARGQDSSISEGGKRRSTVEQAQLLAGELGQDEGQDEVGHAVESHVNEIHENLQNLKEFLRQGESSNSLSGRAGSGGGSGRTAASGGPPRDEFSAILYEIIETEHNYVQDVRFLVDSFLRPMSAIVPAELVRAIFANAEQILQLHAAIDAELGPQLEAAPPVLLQKISECFVTRIPFFKMYATYSSNYVYAASKLRFLRTTDEKVSNWLEKLENQYNTTLLALLIRPVQRICQYPLHFREVSSHLAAGGIDEAGAKQFNAVAESMQNTIAAVNEKVREQENVLRMRGILTAELQGAAELLSPSRSLVFEGHVRLRVEGSLRPEWRAKREYKVYVFSDLMLIARQNLTNSGFSVKVRMPLPEVTCEVGAEADKASFSLHYGGTTYRGSTAAKPDAELLVLKIKEAKSKLNDAPAKLTATGGSSSSLGDAEAMRIAEAAVDYQGSSWMTNKRRGAVRRKSVDHS